MNIKNIGKYLCKLFVSAVAAFMILSLICFFYYNIPVHYTNEAGFTDYVWEENKITFRGTEGFAQGKTNNEGLNNLADYNNQEIDILFLGSSQIEGFNVMPDENATALLNEKFNGEYFAYSLGVSGHDFLRCTQNLGSALERYRPSAYVILEASDLFLKNEDIQAAINGELPKLSSSENRLILTLEKVPVFRHFYNQLDNAIHNNSSSENNDTDNQAEYSEDISDSLGILLNQISQQAKQYDTQLIILYNSYELEGDELTTQQKQLWTDLCNENNIAFLDMTDDFSVALSNNEYVYGFLNTLPNEGHLNKKGHELIADRIYRFITTGD